jgi:uncharacterized protein
MGADDNVGIVKRLFRAVERRDFRPMFEIYDPAVEVHEAPSLPYGGHYHGHEGMIEHGLRYAFTWDRLQTDEDRALEAEFHAAGDRVLVRWRQKARADQHRLNHPVVSDYLVHDGRVVESRMHPFDSAALVSFLEAAAARVDAGH